MNILADGLVVFHQKCMPMMCVGGFLYGKQVFVLIYRAVLSFRLRLLFLILNLAVHGLGFFICQIGF